MDISARGTGASPGTSSAIKSLVIPSGSQPGQRRVSSLLVINGTSERMLGALSTRTGSNGVLTVTPVERVRQHELSEEKKQLWTRAAVRAMQQQEAKTRGSVSFEACKATGGFVELDVAIPARPGVLATAHASFQCLRQRWIDDMQAAGVPMQCPHAIQATSRNSHNISAGSRSVAGRCGLLQHNQ